MPTTTPVRIGVVERGWCGHHPGLARAPQCVFGTPDPAHADHGTRTLGVLSAAHDHALGIVPQAHVLVSAWAPEADSSTLAAAIDAITAELEAGDIALIQAQWRHTPLGDGIAASWDPEVRAAIARGVARDVFMVVPAGNAPDVVAHDILDVPGAALVGAAGHNGAGWIPLGVHSGPVQIYGPGRYVPTLTGTAGWVPGYGGSSAAATVIAGCAAAVQAHVLHRHGARLPASDLLRRMNVGTPLLTVPGVVPDLAQSLLPPNPQASP